MARQRHLSNAPITEAIIDFRVKLPDGFDTKKFLDATTDLSDSYPKNEPIRVFTGAFVMEKGGKPFTQPLREEGIQGYFFKSEDEKNIAQFRVDGFTFNRLHPYTEWESVLSEAKRLWGMYHSLASPEIVKRIAVRYINRLDIKLPTNFNEYLVAPPNVPPTLLQEIKQFLTRLVINVDDKTINLVQAMEPSTEATKITVILDIDVFKTSESGLDISSIWSKFEELHDLKNKVFFESITEKVAEMYE
jgi:uncharacterized protein (TIGR04255 family)